MAPRGYWLVKSEPDVYSWGALVEDGRTEWSGVRNFAARLHLRAMRPGDLALYYHSNKERQVVGIARIVTEAEPDSTAPGEDWSAVDLEPVVPFKEPVTLADIKADGRFEELALVRQSRLSVMPVSKEHFEAILAMGKTRMPRATKSAAKR